MFSLHIQVVGKSIFCVLFIVALIPFWVKAMVFDNRFLPLMQRQWLSPEDGRSHISAHLFAVTSTKAFNDSSEEKEISESLFGEYSLAAIAQDLTILKHKIPLDSSWLDTTIAWHVPGKLEGQGISLCYQQALFYNLSLGFSIFAMRLDSWQNFFPKKVLRNDDIEALDKARRTIHREARLTSDHAHTAGISDIDVYLRYGGYWDYTYKFRSIQAGGRLGVLIPTAKPWNRELSAAVPLGGDRHWGIYLSTDALFELKEDIQCGFLLRVSKRFSRIHECARIPGIHVQSYPFSPLMGTLRIDPGVTLVFSPLVSFSCLRGGFGCRVGYTLTHHWADCWSAPSSEFFPKKRIGGGPGTKWSSDYVSVNAFYDFGKLRESRTLYPILDVCWDIPVSGLTSRGVVKTHRISFGFEVSF